ncbi:protein kinase domain-containing protein [Streptomyces pseudogriseolus]|uniref:protein kinase domain-containing protein n=1 Tax=Streptomyces pseudogriseolus TaxID=36817 RepID=UPI001CE2E558|nr:hypothetical protein [Streptomyces pseudogriseolus]
MLTPVSYPGHLARGGGDTVLVAGRAGSGVGVELGDVLGLVQNPAGGPAYLLGVRPTNDADAVHPVLVKVTGHATAASSAVPAPEPPAADVYAEVRRLARGVKRDYALEKFPLPDGKGGMGIVHEAVHKATGTVVAFKKPRSLRENLTARMLREIEVAQKLGTNRHVMPVLDFSPRAEWFVMPTAQSTAERLQPELQHDPAALRALVDAVASALADAHRLDYLHRDIKPANILLLDGRWVLGDWGIVRRPLGQTTNPSALAPRSRLSSSASPSCLLTRTTLRPPATSTAWARSSAGCSPVSRRKRTCGCCQPGPGEASSGGAPTAIRASARRRSPTASTWSSRRPHRRSTFPSHEPNSS